MWWEMIAFISKLLTLTSRHSLRHCWETLYMPESFTLEKQTLFTQERQFAFPLISLPFRRNNRDFNETSFVMGPWASPYIRSLACGGFSQSPLRIYFIFLSPFIFLHRIILRPSAPTISPPLYPHPSHLTPPCAGSLAHMHTQPCH